MINIEVAHATPERQLILKLHLEEGVTAEQAILKSGIMNEFPNIDLAENKIGIFSKPCQLDTVLRNGDRVEIYRPLIADPKEVRRQRAAEGKETKKGAGSES